MSYFIIEVYHESHRDWGICSYVQYVYIALRLTTRFRIWDLGQACHTNRFTVQVVTEADSLEQLNLLISNFSGSALSSKVKRSNY